METMITSSTLKTKLKSIGEIHEIVTSMKAFAGFNLQNAKQKIPYRRAYQTSIEDAVGDIVTIFPHLARIEHALHEKTLFVLFLSQEGLCGFFNETLLDFFERLPGKQDPALLIIGEKGTEDARSKGVSCTRCLKGPSTVEAIDTYTLELSSYLQEFVERERFGTLTLVYARHDESGTFEPVAQKVLPPDFSKFHKASLKKEPLLYLEGKAILDTLIREYLYTSCYEAFLESVASENQERLNSMVQADNAIKERVKNLRLELNALRQKEITEELLEIVNTYRSMVKR
jgi:F-type H+-transporting ATPase subunit gamma